MQSFYYKAFNYLDSAKPAYLGIYFSLLLHLSILLFAIGLPDFFKSKKIPIPHVIPIEILNISDVTSLTPKKEDKIIDSKKTKQIKQKKFNASENTEIQKRDLIEKPKKNLINKTTTFENTSVNTELETNNTFVTPKLETKKINTKEKKINNLKEEKKTKIEEIETLKINKIKPKLKPKPKPKPIDNIEAKTDIEIASKIKPEINKKEEKKKIDKPKLIPKPEQDFNLATVLKDLRNEDILNTSEENDIKEDNKENNEEDKTLEQNSEVSISEMDLVIQQLRSCFNPRAGTQIVGNEMVKISAKIDKNANVRKDTVQIIDTNISKSNPYYEAITESAVATLYNPLCSKLKLPLNKYESWKDLKITIDYSWIKN